MSNGIVFLKKDNFGVVLDVFLSINWRRILNIVGIILDASLLKEVLAQFWDRLRFF